MLRLKTLTCISIIYIIDTVICFKLVALDPDKNDKIQHRNPFISTNKVSLVKRIVPRDYKTPQFEYDRKHKTVFVPKYRVHKREPVRNGKVFMELYKLFFDPIFYENHNPIAILKLGKQNGRNRNALREAEYDPIGPHSGRPMMSDYIQDNSKVQEPFPHFSLYNYWTYDKALLHELCPPQQVKLGHRCIYAPMVSNLNRK